MKLTKYKRRARQERALERLQKRWRDEIGVPDHARREMVTLKRKLGLN